MYVHKKVVDVCFDCPRSVFLLHSFTHIHRLYGRDKNGSRLENPQKYICQQDSETARICHQIANNFHSFLCARNAICICTLAFVGNPG